MQPQGLWGLGDHSGYVCDVFSRRLKPGSDEDAIRRAADRSKSDPQRLQQRGTARPLYHGGGVINKDGRSLSSDISLLLENKIFSTNQSISQSIVCYGAPRPTFRGASQ